MPLDGVFPLSPTCDHVGTLTRTVEQTAALLDVIASSAIELRPVDGVRIGVLRRQLDDPDLAPGVRARVLEATRGARRGAGFELVDVDLPELDLVDDALGAIILKEAWDVHRGLSSARRDGYGAGTRALLELGARDRRRPRTAPALADRDRVTAGIRAVFDAGRRARRADRRRIVAPPEDPPFGAPEGDIEGRFTAPTTSPGPPRSRFPAGSRRATCPPACSWRPP